MKLSEVGQQVCDRLEVMGMKASYEYPGFVEIPFGDQQWAWAFGTLETTWRGNVQHPDGIEWCGDGADACFDTGIPSTTTDADKVACAIFEHVTMFLNRNRTV